MNADSTGGNFGCSGTSSRKRDSSQSRFPSAAPSSDSKSSPVTSGNPNLASNRSSSSPLHRSSGLGGGGGKGPFSISLGSARKRMILSGQVTHFENISFLPVFLSVWIFLNLWNL